MLVKKLCQVSSAFLNDVVKCCFVYLSCVSRNKNCYMYNNGLGLVGRDVLALYCR